MLVLCCAVKRPFGLEIQVPGGFEVCVVFWEGVAVWPLALPFRIAYA